MNFRVEYSQWNKNDELDNILLAFNECCSCTFYVPDKVNRKQYYINKRVEVPEFLNLFDYLEKTYKVYEKDI